MPTLTIDDLGKAVKKKYAGQYDDLPDAEVGRRVQQKFPGAYDDYSAPVAAAPVLSPVQSPALPATAPTVRPPIAAVPAQPAQPVVAPVAAPLSNGQGAIETSAAPPPPLYAPGTIIDPATFEKMATDNAQRIAAHVTGQQTISADTPTFLQELAHRVTAPFVGPGSAFGIAEGKRTGSKEAAGKDQFEAPLVDFEANQDKVTGGPISKGFTQGVQRFLSGWTTPKSIQLLLATGGLGAEGKLSKLSAEGVGRLAEAGAKYMPRIRALISGGFSLDMIHSALQQSPELIKQVKKGDVEGATRTLTGMVATLGMAALSGHHAATEAGPDLKAAGRAVVEKLENAPDVHGFNVSGDSDTGIARGSERPVSAPKKAKPPTKKAAPKAAAKPAPPVEYTSTGQPIGKPAPAEEKPPAQPVAAPASPPPEVKTTAPETKAETPEVEPTKPTKPPAEGPPIETTATAPPETEAPAERETPEAEPEPAGEHLRYVKTIGKVGGKDDIDVYIHQHPEGWTARGDWNLQGQGGGHLGTSGYETFHPTREAAIEAFLKSAIRKGHGPGMYLDPQYGKDPKLVARAKPMLEWLEALRGKEPAPKKPVTPQVPNEPGAKYVLPTFATGGTGGEKPAVTRAKAIRDARKAGKTYAEAVAAVDAGEPAQPSQPVAAPEEVGPHGPITRSYQENPRAALAWLRSQKNGFAADAVPNEQIGPIGLPYGHEGDAADDYRGGYGVAHIDARHPGWLDAHADDIATWKVDQEFPDREGRISAVRLTDGKGNRAMVSRDWNGKPHEQWLLTGYERSASVASVGVHETPKGAVPTFAATDRSNPSVPLSPAAQAAAPGKGVKSEGATTEGTTAVPPADTGPLDRIPAPGGEGTGGVGPTGEGAELDGGTGDERVLGLHPERSGGGSGAGTDTGHVDGPVAKTPRPARQPRTNDNRPRLTGYRITPADHLGEGTLGEKALQNIEAIRTMKAVEAEGRPATLDEQRKLVKYTGWGALSEVFEHYQSSAAMRAIHSELRDLLTTDEWRTAAATTPNAHYTSPEVIQAIWKAAERLGVKAGARILEPSMGSGNFFGLMPDSLIPDTRLAGVELDPVTERIAKLLYPNAGTYAMGFEKSRFPNNWFDLAISNVPFGNYPVHDPAFKGERRGLTSSIHNYFFAKALDKVRPGGIIAFVTSRYTMDTKNTTVREYLTEHAKLLGAVRLPQTAFEKNAGTTVVTDVIFLQKRVPGDTSAGESWTRAPETKLFPGDENNPTENEYYAKHPEMILGTVKGNMGRFGPEINVIGQLDPERLTEALNSLPENVVSAYEPSEAFNPDALAIAEYPAHGTLKEGAFGLHEGKIVKRAGEMLEPVTLPKETAQRVGGMIGIREAMQNVFRTQLTHAPETEITAARKELNKVYDSFVKRFGILHDRTNTNSFRGDPDDQSILALENFDTKAKTAKKTDIFTQPTLQTYRPVESAGSTKEAMAISLNEYGRINWPRMAQLTGLDPEAMQEELGDLAFRDPATLAWMPADEYLSGDIRQKLAQAQDVAKADPEYERNVRALEAAKPVDLEPGEIVARLGSPWIPPEVVSQFTGELLGISPRDVSVAYTPALATWQMVLRAGKGGAKNLSEWAGGDVPADELISDALNMKVTTVRVLVSRDPDKYAVEPRKTAAAQDMQAKIKKRFREWVWESPTRAEALAKIYNDTFNGIRLREYDGSHLVLPGANPAIEMRPHQKNAIWRIVSSGRNVLLAHVVGAGKTFEMISGAMELRRLGLAKKPMITVPANIVGQFGRDFRLLYPAANILVADEKTFLAKNRQNAMARVATGNWDAVVISHEAFGLLPVADETFNAFLQVEIDELEDAIREQKAGAADKKITKELEKAKKRLETKLRNAADSDRKDTGLTFEQLGVDALFVDEADMFKNLYFVSRATRIAGIPNSESNRAFDMLIKSRHVTDKTGGRLIFATGTPIANTVAEMYTMQRYLAHKELAAAGLARFDAWAQTFGESVTGLETSPDGAGVRVNTRFASFDNIPELQAMFRTFADVQTADMLKLPIPALAGGKYETITVKASQTLLDYIMAKDDHGNFLPGTLMGRIVAIKGGRVDPRADNMLKVTSDGRKAALDLRLIGHGGDVMGSKVNMAADRIFEIWQEGKEKRTTQMVFADLSVPNKDGRWNVYDEIRRKLELKGVPANEIAYAHDATNEVQKKALVEKVNDGEIRVLIGSTGKMGAGVNAQKRLIALHHLDVPWRPRDVEQRQGRILRQGNTNPEVHIIRYVTAPSFDAYMWGMVTRKGKFINQMMTGKLGLRSAEDIGGDSLGAAEAEAAASGNPLIMEKAQIDNDVMRLGALESEHNRKQISARIDRDRQKASIERFAVFIPRLEADIRTRDASTAKEGFSPMTIGKTEYTERKAAGEALVKAAVAHRMDEEVNDIGTYRGFTLKVKGHGAEKLIISGSSDGKNTYTDTNPPTLMYVGEATHWAVLNTQSGLGTLQSLDHEIKTLDHHLTEANRQLDEAKANQKQYATTADTPFMEGALLDKLVARQEELIKLLDLGNSAAAGAEDSDTGGAGPAEETEETPEGEGGKKLDPRAGAVSIDLLTLGLAPFIREDVAPALRTIATGLRDFGGDIMKVLAPTLLDRDAMTGSLIMRGKLAELARKSDQAREALDKASKHFARRPAAENYDFIDRMEMGQPQANAYLDQIAFTLRRLLDDKRADVQSLGTGKLKTFYKDYFPHIWKKPQRAANLFAAFFGKRPLEGGKSFLKRRKLPTIADGRAVGLEPVTDNPVDLVLLKVHEMDRYVMAHETLAEWKSNGIAKFLRGLKPPPKGWARIDDSISTVYGRAAGGEPIVRGHYYAPEGAARIMNHYLSPGLRRFGGYRAILGANNLLNQFQLGLSAFHLGFTAADTTVSKAALGYQALLRGRPIKAAKYFASTPAAAFTTLLTGDKVLKEWYRPGSQGAAIGAIADALQTAGGRARMDQMYRTQIAEKMQEALRKGNILGAALRLPFAGVEWTSNLIMNEIVPRMKLGAFADMARFHMDELGPNASFEDVRRVLVQDWNSVENRLGEMTYDNLFWDKTAKDLAMIAVRSVGWNLGTLREVGGAIGDIAWQPANAMRGRPVNLNRISYLLALVTVNAAMSSIYQYLKTGKGPSDPEDYFFPKNGEIDEKGHAQRVSWPTYVKDIYHYGTHPARTLESKVAPIWSAFGEMIHNRDFFSTEIRNPDDPLVKQLGDLAKYVAKTAVPIGIRNYQRETALGSSISTRAEQFVGISPAPADINQSPAERLAHELAAPGGETRTAASAARSDMRNSLTRSLRSHKGVPEDVKAAMTAGKFSSADVAQAVRAAGEVPIQRSFKVLGIADAVKVYRAATPGEKLLLRVMLVDKLKGALKREAPADRAKTLADVKAALKP